MTFDLYVPVSRLAVRFGHFFIGSLKRILLQNSFYSFLLAVLFYNTCCLMSQINPKNKNMTNLDMNLGQLVCLVLDWVGCGVA